MTVDVVGNGVSRSDADAGDGSSERIEERILRQGEFAGALNAQGHNDVLVLRRESGRDVLTERRLALHYLDGQGEEVNSVRGLGRRLDRDKGAVSMDLHRLAELDIIEYEGKGEGEAKRPVLNSSLLSQSFTS